MNARRPHPSRRGSRNRSAVPLDLTFVDFFRLLLAGLVLFALLARPGRGQVTRVVPPEIPAPSAVAGELLATAADGSRHPLPRLATRIDVAVTGPLARTVVEQRFRNPDAAPVEAVYRFPLPGDAAVDTLRLQVGDRVVEGELREKGEARRAYAEARANGQRAALLVREPSNLFTTSVAPLGAGEEVTVHLEYQEIVTWQAGWFRLTVPLATTPRYAPAADAAPGAGGPASPQDAGLVVPRFAAGAAPPARVDLRVTIDAGAAIVASASPTHAVVAKRLDGRAGRRLEVRLADGPVPDDRDFVLEWEPLRDATPHAALYTEEFEGSTFALAMLLPPADDVPAAEPVPREVTIVLDSSGSMAGASLEQAKAAVLMALDRLRPGDTFDLVNFDSTAQILFPAPVPADAAALAEAREAVADIQAEGGTEMLPALELALADRPPTAAVRQVVFVTDGAVANEADVEAYVRAHLGDRRLFTVAIGSAPNSYFLRRAASFGRGTFTAIVSTAEVAERMGALLAALASPVLHDLELRWDDPGAEPAPADAVPDLYLGEPLVVVARLPAGLAGLAVSGRHGIDEPWQAKLTARPQTQRSQAGIHRLWAQRRFQDVLDRSVAGGGTVPEATRAELVELALAHGIVTRYTSLVAVDRSESVVAPGTHLPVRAVRAPLPASSDPAATLPQGGTPAALLRTIGLALLATAAAAFLRRRAA